MTDDGATQNPREIRARQRLTEGRLILVRKNHAVRCIERAEKKIVGLRTQQHELRKSIRKFDAKLEFLREQEVLDEPLPDGVRTLHDRLVAARVEAERDDITVARKRELNENEIPHVLERLQQVCPHTLVFDRDRYTGSSMYDYEDGFPAWRMCAICGISETAKFQQGLEDIFEVLQDSSKRVFRKMMFRYTREEPLLQANNPLEEIYRLFGHASAE